jgi:hypothetical protein
VLALALLVGQRIITYWDKVKKRQELDLATSKEFHKIYGEFKELTKLWVVLYRKTHFDQYKSLAFPEESFPEEVRWELLRRAAAAESELESVLIKLATERSLSYKDLYALGIFRQGYEQVRHSIRDGSNPTFGYSWDPRYPVFDEVACRVAYIISEDKRPWKSPPKKAKLNLQRIKQVGPKGLDKALSDGWENAANAAEEEARRTEGKGPREDRRA